MRWRAAGWRRLRGFTRGADLDRRLREEIQFHLDQQAAQHEQAGLSAAEARRQAHVAFGALQNAREAARDEVRPAWTEDVLRDVRHGARALRRTPAFTVVSMLTMALGIGATTAVFTVINAVLIRPLPYPDADRLVDLAHRARGVDLPSGMVSMSATQLFSYRDHTRVFEALGLWTRGLITVTGDGDPEQVRSLQATHGTLEALAVPPARGRGFSLADERPGSTDVVILGHGFWQRRFGGDASVIGRRIMVDSRPREVIGVMPAEFEFLSEAVEILVPLQFDPARLRLGAFNFRGIARLKPGVTIDQANADIARVMPGWLRAWPAPPGISATVFENARFEPDLQPLKTAVVGDIGRLLWVVMGAVGVVLLIACANVANLLLVRGEGRQQELAIRSALGAGRRRLVRALLVESLLLGLAGGVLGLALAVGGVRVLVTTSADMLPRSAGIGLDPVVMLFTVAVSVLSGLGFGVMTALRRVGPHLAQDLTATSRTSSPSRSRRRARQTLVIVQVALATVLLVGSGLMIRTFAALNRVDVGVTGVDDVQLFRLRLPEALVPDAERVFQTHRDLRDRLSAIPGVTAVTFGSAGPLQRANAGDPLVADHQTFAEGQVPPVRLFKFISPEYFETIGARLVAGRAFTSSDIESNRPVAILTENLARQMWGSAAKAVGGRVREMPTSPWREVVGVVADIRDQGLLGPAPATAYWPAFMRDFGGEPIRAGRGMTFVLRTDRAGTEALMSDVRQAVRAISPNLALTDVRTLDELYRGFLVQTSVTLSLLGISAAMAALLSLIGIYGVLSYTASQRARELGLRTALGAGPGSLRAMFVRDGLRLSVIGVAAGLTAAIGLTQFMTSLLVGVTAVDPLTYVIVGGALAAAAGLASYVPARRATSGNPIDVLRAS